MTTLSIEELAKNNKKEFLASAEERRLQLEFTQTIRSLAESTTQTLVRAVDKHHALRQLYPSEIATLKGICGCSSKDWSKLCLLLSPADQVQADQSEQLRTLVSNTHFDGTVVLAISGPDDEKTTSQLEPWSKCPRGIHGNRLISNSIISTQSWVTGNTVVCDTHICHNAVVMGCGTITSTGDTNNTQFLQGNAELSLSVGPESGGGRPLVVEPESDMIQVCQQLSGRRDTLALPTTTIKQTHSLRFPMNVISSHCIVRDTPTMQGLYMAPSSSIHAATQIQNVVMLPTSSIQNACTVVNARLQWKTSIVNHSDVSNTLLMEEAHIGPNSLVASCILGPDVQVSAGECHCSILGPNLNSHHQSLVISVLWPLGRGNVGYGANIGSNHTGRIPDQEVSSGEGVFWGLSCIVKFPVNLTMAPYSIVAAGTSVPPQRVCMPFSLIVSSDSGGNNNIIPGWVLSSSPYTIARSEKKYATRRKASRHKHYTGWKIIRPEIVNMCYWARKQLTSVEGQAQSNFVTDKAIRGIGNNVLSEKGRRSGIKAYTECIQRFALEGLLFWMIQKAGNGGAVTEQALQEEFASVPTCAVNENVDNLYDNVTWPLFPWEASSESQMWAYQKALLLEEFPTMKDGDISSWISSMLETLVVLEKGYAASIFKSKKRDDQRGAQTVPGYAGCHTAADNDVVIKDANERAAEVEAAAGRIIKLLKSYQRSKL